MSALDVMDKVVAAGAQSVVIRVKVVPGARRERVAGVLGDRLKLAVAVPPEKGKANEAVCALVAKTLGVAVRDVQVVAGHTQPLKTVEVTGGDVTAVKRKLCEVV